MKSYLRFRGSLLRLFAVLSLTYVSVASTNVKVMTYNADEGTDFSAIIAVLSSQNTTQQAFLDAVSATLTEVANSRPDVRAQLIANEIAAAEPDLVGLQEAAYWNSSETGQIDLLQTILAALGGKYAAIITVPEYQISIPGLVTFIDRDVILPVLMNLGCKSGVPTKGTTVPSSLSRGFRRTSRLPLSPADGAMLMRS